MFVILICFLLIDLMDTFCELCLSVKENCGIASSAQSKGRQANRQTDRQTGRSGKWITTSTSTHQGMKHLTLSVSLAFSQPASRWCIPLSLCCRVALQVISGRKCGASHQKHEDMRTSRISFFFFPPQFLKSILRVFPSSLSGHYM